MVIDGKIIKCNNMKLDLNYRVNCEECFFFTTLVNNAELYPVELKYCTFKQIELIEKYPYCSYYCTNKEEADKIKVIEESFKLKAIELDKINSVQKLKLCTELNDENGVYGV